jgi:two-component system response regulator
MMELNNLRIILLVEDDGDHAELTMRTLKEHKVLNNIVWVADAESALDYLYRRGRYAKAVGEPMPALVLIDIKLPGMNGIDLLKELQKDPKLKLIPAVMLTTSSRDEEVLASYMNGANGYVTKPVEFSEFHRAVNGLALFWGLINQPPPTNGPH